MPKTITRSEPVHLHWITGFPSEQLKTGLRLAVAGCLALAIGMYANFHEAKWGLMFVILAVALQQTMGGLLGQFLVTIVATVAGGILGLFLMIVAPQFPVLFALLLGAAIYISTYCSLASSSPRAFLLMRITIIMIACLGLTTQTSTGIWALWRLFEAVFAFVISFVVCSLIKPEPAHQELDKSVAKTLVDCKTFLLGVTSELRQGPVPVEGAVGSRAAPFQPNPRLRSLYADARREGTMKAWQPAIYLKVLDGLEDLASIARYLSVHRSRRSPLLPTAKRALETFEKEIETIFRQLVQLLSDKGGDKVSTNRLEAAIDEVHRALISSTEQRIEGDYSIDEKASRSSFLACLREVSNSVREIATFVNSLYEGPGTVPTNIRDLERGGFLAEVLAHPDPMNVTGSLKIAIATVVAVIIAWGLDWQVPVYAIVFVSMIGGGLTLGAGLTLEGGKDEALAAALGFVLAGILSSLVTVFAFPIMDRLPGLLGVFFVVFFICGYCTSRGGTIGLLAIAAAIGMELMVVGRTAKVIDLQQIWHIVTSVLLGVTIGLIVHYAMWPVRASAVLREKAAQAMEFLSEAYGKSTLLQRDPGENRLAPEKLLRTYLKNLQDQRRLWGQAARNPTEVPVSSASLQEVMSAQLHLGDSVLRAGLVAASDSGSITKSTATSFHELDGAILEGMTSLARDLRTGEAITVSLAELDQAEQELRAHLGELRSSDSEKHASAEHIRCFEILYYGRILIADNLRRFVKALGVSTPSHS